MHVLLSACLLAALPVMEHGAAPLHSGCVVAAPHEGFDANTAPIARDVAQRLRTGWVTATGYRQVSKQRWINVNRPTECRFEGRVRLRKALNTKRAKQAYAEYQRRLNKASGRAPLDLLIEIHGHARRARIGGKRVKVQVIELATQGFSEAELKALRKRYDALVAKLPAEDRVQLAIEQLDATYAYQGETIRFYFRASGSKRAGSLSPARSRQALHFELPQAIRFHPQRRLRYARLLADLLRPLVKSARARAAAAKSPQKSE